MQFYCPDEPQLCPRSPARSGNRKASHCRYWNTISFREHLSRTLQIILSTFCTRSKSQTSRRRRVDLSTAAVYHCSGRKSKIYSSVRQSRLLRLANLFRVSLPGLYQVVGLTGVRVSDSGIRLLSQLNGPGQSQSWLYQTLVKLTSFLVCLSILVTRCRHIRTAAAALPELVDAMCPTHFLNVNPHLLADSSENTCTGPLRFAW